MYRILKLPVKMIFHNYMKMIFYCNKKIDSDEKFRNMFFITSYPSSPVIYYKIGYSNEYNVDFCIVNYSNFNHTKRLFHCLLYFRKLDYFVDFYENKLVKIYPSEMLKINQNFISTIYDISLSLICQNGRDYFNVNNCRSFIDFIYSEKSKIYKVSKETLIKHGYEKFKID